MTIPPLDICPPLFTSIIRTPTVSNMAAMRAFLGLAIMAILVHKAIGATYTVGGASGWGLGTNYQSWEASQSFKTGDSLTFSYGIFHNVLEVSKADYDTCSTSSPVMTATDGNTVVKLSSPGNRYFICGAIGHCNLGMKVAIKTVAAAADTTPPLPSVTPPPSAPVVPPPASVTPPPSTPVVPPPAPSPHHPKHQSPPPKASTPPSKAPSSHSLDPTIAPNVAPSAEPSRPKASELAATAAPTPQVSAAADFGCKAKAVTGIAVSMLMVLAL